jgi:hypothetical protein
MILLTAFIISVLVGDLNAVAVCAVIEQFSEPISLLVFLAMFVGVIPIAWRVAVRVTEPKIPEPKIPEPKIPETKSPVPGPSR